MADEELNETEETEEEETDDESSDSGSDSGGDQWDKLRGIVREEVSGALKGELGKWLRSGKNGSNNSSRKESNSQRKRGFLEEIFNPNKK